MTLLWGCPNKDDSAAKHSKICHLSDEHAWENLQEGCLAFSWYSCGPLENFELNLCKMCRLQQQLKQPEKKRKKIIACTHGPLQMRTSLQGKHEIQQYVLFSKNEKILTKIFSEPLSNSWKTAVQKVFNSSPAGARTELVHLEFASWWPALKEWPTFDPKSS